MGQGVHERKVEERRRGLERALSGGTREAIGAGGGMEVDGLSEGGQRKEKEGFEKAVLEEGYQGSYAQWVDLNTYKARVAAQQVKENLAASPLLASSSSSSLGRKESEGKERWTKAAKRERKGQTEHAFVNAKQTMNEPPPEPFPTDIFDKLRLVEEEEVEEPKGPKRRIFPASLSPEDQALVRRLQTTGPMNTPIAKIDGGEMTRKDVLLLSGKNWLNDESITFYSRLINARSKRFDEEEEKGGKRMDERGMGYKKVISFNSFFYKKLSDAGYKGVKRFSKRLGDVFAQDVIIVPINQGNQHWVCAAINLTDKRFEYYDSLGGANKTVYQWLRKYIVEEHLDKKGTELSLDGWVDWWDEEVPKQENICDCGVFTCQFMESLSREGDGFDFTQKNMPYFRDKMVLEMKNLELIVEDFE